MLGVTIDGEPDLSESGRWRGKAGMEKTGDASSVADGVDDGTGELGADIMSETIEGLGSGVIGMNEGTSLRMLVSGIPQSGRSS